MKGPLFPEAENIAKEIITDRRGFGYYPSLLVDSIKVEVIDEEIPQWIVGYKDWYEDENTGWSEGEWYIEDTLVEIVPEGFELTQILDTDKHSHPTRALFKKI